MADVPASLNSWSSTASSNLPNDNTTLGSGLADNLQALQAVVRGDLASKGTDIASSAAPDVGAVVGLYHDLTGANTLTGLGSTASAGIWKILQTDSTPVFKHSTAMAMPGSADYSASTGDVLGFMCEATNQWRCMFLQKANGEDVKLGANGLGIAAAATVDLDAAVGWAVDVTGNASVSAATLSAGRTRFVRFTGTPPLIHGASFVLPGSATIQAAAGDIAIFRGYASSVVRCIGYQKASGLPTVDTVGMVKLNSGTVSAAATLDIVMTSYTAYKNKLLVLNSFVPATDTANLVARVSTDGGSNYDAGAGAYVYHINAGVQDTTVSNTAGTDTGMALSGGVGNVAGEGVSSWLYMMDTTNTSHLPKFWAKSVVHNSDGNLEGRSSEYARDAAQDTDAIRILFSSGNITSGTWELYGYS